MIKTVPAIDGNEMPVDAQTVQHSAAEVNRFVRQDGEFAVRQTVERFAHTRIKPRVLEHVRAIIREEHLQPGLDIWFRGLVP